MRDLFERLDDVLSLQEGERQALYQEVRDRASSTAVDFERELHALPLDKPSCLFEIYEALAADASSHVGVLERETTRLLRSLEQDPGGRHPRVALEAMTLVTDEQARARLSAQLVQAANSPSFGVRRTVAWLLPSLAEPDAARPTLHGMVSDSDWRVRALTDIALVEYGDDSRLRLSDRLRARFSDVHG